MWVVYKVKARNIYDRVSNINLENEGYNESIYQDQMIPRNNTPSNELDFECILHGGDME